VRKHTQRFPFQNLMVIMVVVWMMGANIASSKSGPESQETPVDSSHAKSSLQKRNPTYQMRELVRKSDWDGIRTLFGSLDDGSGKMHFASELMQLGVKGEEYFRYLAERAQVTIEREVPFPMKFDEKRKFVRGQMSEAFVAWCAEHQVEPGEMLEIVVYKDPVPVLWLAESGDSRALPLLLRGLTAPNLYVRLQAAHGLALIGDARAIAPLIQAINQLPEDFRQAMTNYLAYFDHPEAQAALARFIQDPQERQRANASVHRDRARRKNLSKYVFGDSARPSQP